jgi:hypothetical protein
VPIQANISYFLKLAGQNYPSQQIRDAVENNISFSQAIGGTGDLYSSRMWNSLASPVVASGLVAANSTYQFSPLGIDLEATNEARDLIVNGYDNATQSTPITLVVNTTDALTKNVMVACLCSMTLGINVQTGNVQSYF